MQSFQIPQEACSHVGKSLKAIRQHVLPRFLMKGFASRTEGKEIYTLVYRTEVKPFEANITKVGVEKYFYGKEGELSVDDEITELEGKYAPLIDELRNIQGNIEITDQRTPDLITYLVIRTKHVPEGGSSISFRSAFWPSSVILSVPSISTPNLPLIDLTDNR